MLALQHSQPPAEARVAWHFIQVLQGVFFFSLQQPNS